MADESHGVRAIRAYEQAVLDGHDLAGQFNVAVKGRQGMACITQKGIQIWGHEISDGLQGVLDWESVCEFDVDRRRIVTTDGRQVELRHRAPSVSPGAGLSDAGDGRERFHGSTHIEPFAPQVESLESSADVIPEAPRGFQGSIPTSRQPASAASGAPGVGPDEWFADGAVLGSQDDVDRARRNVEFAAKVLMLVVVAMILLLLIRPVFDADEAIEEPVSTAYYD